MQQLLQRPETAFEAKQLSSVTLLLNTVSKLYILTPF